MNANVDDALKSMFHTIASRASEQLSKKPVYSDIDFIQLGLTFFVALALLVSAWILFEYLARHESAKNMYRQRLYHPKCLAATQCGSDHRDAPPDVMAGKSVLFGAFGIPSDRLVPLMGPGANLSYRLMRHCTYFAHFAMVYSLLVLVPLYLSQFYHRAHEKHELLSMIAVNYVSPLNPSHMWVLVISAYIMCGYWTLVVYAEWQHVKSVRLSWEHDSRSFHLQSHYSLLIERSKGEKKVDLKSYLSRLLGKDSEDEVPVVTTVHETQRLVDLKHRRYWATKLPPMCFSKKSKEELLADYDSAIRIETSRVRALVIDAHHGSSVKGYRNPTFSTVLSPTADDKPEAGIGASTMQTTSSIAQTFVRLFITSRVPTSFVTLRSMTSRTVLAHMYRAQGDSFARLTPAPPPCDIIWSNVTVERKVIVARRTFMRILLIVFGVLYAIPLVKIQQFAREYSKKAAENLPPDQSMAEADFGSEQWRNELVSLYLPAIAQVLITQSLAPVFRFISLKYERFKNYQDVSRYVLHRAFLFQLLTIYVIVFSDIWFDVSMFAGGFLSLIDSVLFHLRRLGQDIPPVALYFASTVIVSLVTETASEMLNPVDLGIALFNRYVRGNLDAWKQTSMVQFKYSSSMTSYLTLLNIMFTFSLIAPVVIFFCWIFWTISYVWNTYAFIYLNNRRSEVGTSFSSTIYSGICASLIYSQLALFFVIWSYDSTKWNHHLTGQVYAVAILVCLLLAFKYLVMRNFYTHSNEFTSLALSSEIDRINKPDDVAKLFTQEYYYQPEARDDTESMVLTLDQPDMEAGKDVETPNVFDEETSRLINT